MANRTMADVERAAREVSLNGIKNATRTGGTDMPIRFQANTMNELVLSLLDGKKVLAALVAEIQAGREPASGLVAAAYSLAGYDYEEGKGNRRYMDAVTRKILDQAIQLHKSYEEALGIARASIQALDEADGRRKTERAKLGV